MNYIEFCFGVVTGVILLALVIRHRTSADADRLNVLNLFGWTVTCSDGRWGVLKRVNGEMKVIGSTHANVRDAIDAAAKIEIA